MREGAYDYVTKPFKVDELRIVVEKALEKKLLSSENRRLRQELRSHTRDRSIIGNSASVRKVMDLIAQVADAYEDIASAYIELNNYVEAFAMLNKAFALREGLEADRFDVAYWEFAMAQVLWDGPPNTIRDRELALERARRCSGLRSRRLRVGGHVPSPARHHPRRGGRDRQRDSGSDA